MVLLGADPHPPFPPLPRRGGQAVKERGASCEGEGGKLERRGGQAVKAMGQAGKARGASWKGDGGQAGKGEGVLFELYFGVHSYLEVAIVFDFDFDGID